MKIRFDKVCDDCCSWAYDRGSPRSRVEFVRNPTQLERECSTCNGHKYILTKLGRKVLEFIDRWRPQ